MANGDSKSRISKPVIHKKIGHSPQKPLGKLEEASSALYRSENP